MRPILDDERNRVGGTSFDKASSGLLERNERFEYNRSNPFLFRDTMIKLIEAPVLEYKKLTAA